MKWLFSFRARLILSVFPVVAVVTTATLLLAEWRFAKAYQGLFEEHFESQISSFSSARKKRTEALSEVLQKVARRPDVLSAMQRRDITALNQALRPQLESLATERLQAELPGGSGHGPKAEAEEPGAQPRNHAALGRLAAKLLPSQMPYLAIIDPEGEFLDLPKKGVGGQPGRSAAFGGQGKEPPGSAEFRRKSGRLQWLGQRQLADVLQEQQVGYMRVEFGDEHRAEQVREVFITPVREGSHFLGALLFGLPLQVFAERQLYEQTKRSEFGEIMSGIWVEEGLVTTTIPKQQREEIAEHVAQSIHRTGRTQREMTVTIDGVRHQIFYRLLNPGSPFPLAAQVNLYPLAAMDRQVAELRRDVGSLGALALLVSLLLVLWVSRGLSGPISAIVAGTHEIEQGNYEVRVPVRRRDEVGRLATAFNEMAAGLALQERYRSVLNAVADRAVAEQLIAQSSALGGEVRHVTMLFCDIRGFTALTENMPPAEVIDLLNEHMTALTQVAYEHGGIVDKFVGDLIMVLFGAPVTTGQDAASAVRCALSMLEIRRQLNATTQHAVEVGIGVATGAVVAGCMGSDQRLSYTVLGHRVNLASRLCSIAQAGEIIMDEETYSEARQLIQAEPMPPMQLKGISEPVHPWRVLPSYPVSESECLPPAQSLIS